MSGKAGCGACCFRVTAGRVGGSWASRQGKGVCRPLVQHAALGGLTRGIADHNAKPAD